MKIITKPTVYLIGKQVIDEAELGRFLDAHDVGHWETDTEVGAEKMVEVAGRVCYMSFAKPRPGGNKAYIDHILEVGHGSVLEHANFTLLIEGVSRSLTHELVRHRAGFAYSQISQRYVDESNCAFVRPPGIKPGSVADVVWSSSVGWALGRYQALVDVLEGDFAHIEDKTQRRKAIRETARSVLPNATETKITVTANARAWRHFIEMRGSEHADAEIQRLAIAVLDVLCNAAPNLFGDYTIQNGCISTPFRKV
ncbi:THY1 Predicted alternative thymidylate synthase [uncultured Caudovirales phage]|uniref:THY1 Predicted alternative thymidylate synthase n=1 Tax=uncultured Caudovirales phage TaxID=2100421 RepID=A0A6J7WF43_9CAUD|nr:THY1 Predicted alternative thymidylate synthase [uncultured Caudovirales phage]